MARSAGALNISLVFVISNSFAAYNSKITNGSAITDHNFFFLSCSHQVFLPPYLMGPRKLERLVWGDDPLPTSPESASLCEEAEGDL